MNPAPQQNKKSDSNQKGKIDEDSKLIKSKKTSSKEVQGLITNLKSSMSSTGDDSDKIYSKILSSLETKHHGGEASLLQLDKPAETEKP